VFTVTTSGSEDAACQELKTQTTDCQDSQPIAPTDE
jgi:hypothetical protein